MPRRRNRNRRPNRRRTGARDTVVLRSKLFLQAPLVTGTSRLQMFPDAIGYQQIADQFELWQLRSLRYRIIPGGTITGNQAAAYIPGIVDNFASADVSTLSQVPFTAILGTRQTNPTPWISVPRSQLSSYASWYKTVQGTPDTDLEFQGYLYLAGTGSDVLWLDMETTIALKNKVAQGLTPQLRRDQAMISERDRLLKILNYNPVPKTPSTPSMYLPPPQ